MSISDINVALALLGEQDYSHHTHDELKAFVIEHQLTLQRNMLEAFVALPETLALAAFQKKVILELDDDTSAYGSEDLADELLPEMLEQMEFELEDMLDDCKSN